MAPGFPIIYPLLAQVITPEKRHTGTFLGSRPSGVCVHYLADRDCARARAADDAKGLGYHLVIDRDGKIYQTAYLDRMVAHAGQAMWNGHSPNHAFAAVAIASWGFLEGKGPEFKSWSGAAVLGAEAALRPDNLTGALGYWDAATDVQAARLFDVLSWFVVFGVDPENICGHDEAAIPLGRKVDPGGALPWTMPALRAMLARKARP